MPSALSPTAGLRRLDRRSLKAWLLYVAALLPALLGFVLRFIGT